MSNEPLSNKHNDLPASFRGHIDELLSRLSHEGVMTATIAEPPPAKDRPKDWSRSPAYHNQALFKQFND